LRCLKNKSGFRGSAGIPCSNIPKDNVLKPCLIKEILILLSINLLCLLFLIKPGTAYAQQNAEIKTEFDTVVVKKHSPTKATLFSVVLPGLGQVYNKKYWKIPIIYAGFGIFTYFIVKNSKEYKKYLEAYNYVVSGDTMPIDNDYAYKYNKDQLLQGKNYYRRNMEVSYILTGVWYILNIIDASVDAHFFDYDISDDLSIRIDPMINDRFQYNGTVTGIKLTLKF
jgi:hypothetical protein